MTSLAHLSSEKLVELARPTWLHLDIGSLSTLLDHNPVFIREYVQGQHVIDLGCGKSYNKVGEKIISLGAASYVGVDPMNTLSPDLQRTGSIRYLETDALTHLLAQPDNSAIIIASAIFSEPLIPKAFDKPPVKAIKEEYLQRLFPQVYRVTPTVCFGYELFHPADAMAAEVGFAVERFHKERGRTTESVGLRGGILNDFFILQK